MLVTHAPAAAFLNPFSEISTLVVICNIRDPITGQNYTHDPRYTAQKAEAYLKKTQIGDTANFGLEFEHFDFNQSDPYLAKLQVREAIAHGVDRQSIITRTVGEIEKGITPLGSRMLVSSDGS